MPSPSGISTKTIGLLLAGLLTLVFAIIIWTSIAGNQTPTPPRSDFFPDDITEEIPNIEDTQTGGAMLVTMVDKDDPTRVAATLKADRFEPIGEGRRRLDNPESWIYTKDGRAIKITADYATMLMPDPNEPPDSGTLEGNILIESFDQLDQTKPTLQARFDAPLEFERRYLRLRSAGHFNITSDAFDLAGTDLTVILNELRDRVELIDIAQGDSIVIRTPSKSKQAPSSTSATPPTQGSATPNTQQQAAPKDQTTQRAQQTQQNQAQQDPTPQDPIQAIVNQYHIVLNDQVIAHASGSGSAKSDRLELWLALTDGQLPDDAIRAINFTPSSKPAPNQSPNPTTEPTTGPTTGPTTQQATKPQAPPSSQPTQSTTQSAPSPTDITITWSGKMTLRPIDDAVPSQLTNNSLALKLIANDNAGITFDVPNQHFTGQAFAATYLATQGIVELESQQTKAGIIRLIAQDAGTLNATALNANLATGKITLNNRGSISTTPQDPNTPDSNASIQWKKSATFTIATNTQTNTLTDRLTNATFIGGVIGRQSGNTVGARTLQADFDPQKPSSISLQTITMHEGVLASASRSIISGTDLVIDLVPGIDEKSITPTTLTATGKVLGRTPDQLLKADHLVVDMSQSHDGKVIVQSANAKGNVRYTDSKRSTAQADSLDANAVDQTMTLLGSPAQVGQGGSTITGNHINLNAQRKAIEVLGPGSFDHDIALDNDQPNTPTNSITGHIRTTWKGSMRFDDALGSIECEQQVKVISTPDAYTRDTIDAHRAQIKLTPMPTNDPIAGQSTNRPRQKDQRALLNARIFGYAPPGQDPIPAKVESRTYDKDDLERVISLIYLEGAQIYADNQAQTLAVPAPGTLLIMDRSQDDSSNEKKGENRDESEDQGSSSPANPNAGLTRFTWQGNMSLDRAQGTATFAEKVIVRQKTISTGKLASLFTDQLDARFVIGEQTQATDESDPPAQPKGPQSTRLLGVDALGSVRFLYEGKELLADSAIYNAISDSLFASAIDNKLVTLYDDAQPAPLSAKTMRWYLEQDRIEINAPTPTRSTGG